MGGPESVFLSSIQEVVICDTIRRCIGFLTHVEAPTSTSYRVICSGVDVEYPEPSTFFGDMARSLQTRADASVNGLRIELQAQFRNCSYTLYRPDTTKQSRPRFAEVGPFRAGYREQIFCFFSPLSSDAPHLSHMMSSSFNPMDCAAIETLEIKFALHESYDAAFWATTLARFPNLTTLYLADMPWTPALFALTPSDAGDDIALPRLRYLWLHVLDVRGVSSQTGHDSVKRHSSSQILRLLSSRLRAGKPIERLRIDILYAPNLSRANKILLPRLRALVPLVEVMEVRGGDPETEHESDLNPLEASESDSE